MKAKPKKPPKGSWIVTLEVTVRREIICDDCTEDEARALPYEFAVDEQDKEQIDWKFIRIEPNL